MSAWNYRIMNLAELIGSWSKDSIKVGCVIVDENNKILATGYNGMPHWYDDTKLSSLTREDRSRMITHAEINALNILNEVHYQKKLKLYTTRAPCIYCTFSIIQSFINIQEVYYLNDKDPKDIEKSLKLLNENEIKTKEVI